MVSKINHNKITQLIKTFKTIGLDEMDSVKLMKRNDTKYAVHEKKLPEILNIAKDSYRILMIEEQVFFNYSTAYYDTSDLHMYLSHHNNKANRFKIRQRDYIDTNNSFLEIKYKSNKNKTIKKRLECYSNTLASREAKNFVQDFTPYTVDDLVLQLKVKFNRFTLVNLNTKERITIDMNIHFNKREERINLHNLSIIEVKKQHPADSSPFCKIIKASSVRPFSLSKYCTGQMLLNNNSIRYNRFKKKLLKIEKITQDRDVYAG